MYQPSFGRAHFAPAPARLVIRRRTTKISSTTAHTWRLPFGLHESPEVWKKTKAPSKGSRETEETASRKDSGQTQDTAPIEDSWETEESASEGSSEHDAGTQPEVEEETYTPVEFVCDEHLKDTWWARDRAARLRLPPSQRPARAVPSSKCPPTGAGILLCDRSLRNAAYERGECTKAERDATALSQIGLKPTPTPAQEKKHQGQGVDQDPPLHQNNASLVFPRVGRVGFYTLESALPARESAPNSLGC